MFIATPIKTNRSSVGATQAPNTLRSYGTLKCKHPAIFKHSIPTGWCRRIAQ
jgi:hypothetical protein